MKYILNSLAHFILILTSYFLIPVILWLALTWGMFETISKISPPFMPQSANEGLVALWSIAPRCLPLMLCALPITGFLLVKLAA